MGLGGAVWKFLGGKQEFSSVADSYWLSLTGFFAWAIGGQGENLESGGAREIPLQGLSTSFKKRFSLFVFTHCVVNPMVEKWRLLVPMHFPEDWQSWVSFYTVIFICSPLSVKWLCTSFKYAFLFFPFSHKTLIKNKDKYWLLFYWVICL